MVELESGLKLRAKVRSIAPFRHPELSFPGLHGYVGNIKDSNIIRLDADDFLYTTSNMHNGQRVEKIEELFILIRDKLPSLTTVGQHGEFIKNYSKIFDITFDDPNSLKVLNYVLNTKDRKFNPGGWKTKSGKMWTCTYGLEHLVENERFTDHYDSLKPYSTANVFNLDKLESRFEPEYTN